MPGRHRAAETLTEKIADYGRAALTLASMVGDTLILNPTPRTIGIQATFPKAETPESSDAGR